MCELVTCGSECANAYARDVCSRDLPDSERVAAPLDTGSEVGLCLQY